MGYLHYHINGFKGVVSYRSDGIVYELITVKEYSSYALAESAIQLVINSICSTDDFDLAVIMSQVHNKRRGKFYI
jgi:hypothetical protein